MAYRHGARERQAMQELDKAAMGERIRQIRLRAGLRQWELAKLLGTTQSAVHKYEHGVVPEPRRLVELAKVGNTSIEWVLTGTHWENGSPNQQRLSPDLLNTACLLREILDERRASVDEALRIVRQAVKALEGGNGGPDVPELETVTSSLQNHSSETLRILETAWKIQNAVLHQILGDADGRLRNASISDDAKE